MLRSVSGVMGDVSKNMKLYCESEKTRAESNELEENTVLIEGSGMTLLNDDQMKIRPRSGVRSEVVRWVGKESEV